MAQGPLVPTDTVDDLRAHRLDVDRRLRQVRCDVSRGHYESDRPVTRHVAIEETEGTGDHPRHEIVVHRHRVAIDRHRIKSCVAAGVGGDGSQPGAGGAVAPKVIRHVHGNPIGGTHGAKRRAPLHEIALDPGTA